MTDGNRERKDRVRVPRDEPPGTRLVGMARFLLLLLLLLLLLSHFSRVRLCATP